MLFQRDMMEDPDCLHSSPIVHGSREYQCQLDKIMQMREKWRRVCEQR